jgi:DNA (cytosine-5)-methyltransferase 1
MLTIGSICAGGCDALSLGLEWAGLGPTIWQVEIDEERRANLARHWPDADRSVTDVYDGAALALPRPGIVACSSPCQDLSSAGKRDGLDGSRSRAWFACERIIGALRPRFAVVENVASGANNWVPFIRSGLERFGYSTLPIPVAAADLGAPHYRRRVFVLAHLDEHREPSVAVDAEVAGASKDVGHTEREREPRLFDRRASGTGGREAFRSGGAREHAGWPAELEVVTRLHGVPSRVVSMLGDAPTPQQAEVVGWVIRELIAGMEAA